jgi:putative solute:sodium symporter small subunit
MVTARHSLDELPAITGGRAAAQRVRPTAQYGAGAPRAPLGTTAPAVPPGQAAAADVAWSASALEARYWRQLRRVTLTLLGCWTVLVLGLPWCADLLNQWRVGGFPLGFWLSSQGAVGGFVLLIVAYVVVVERLDEAYLRERQAGVDGCGNRPCA